MSRRVRVLVLSALLLAPASVAAAPSWAIQSPASRLGFVATWEGSPFEGVFHRFDGVIVFDPADLAGSRFEVHIDLTSADTRSEDRDTALADRDWFDTARFPRAVYRSAGFRDLGGGRFEADGHLTLKGVSRPVPVRFAWRQAPGGAVLTGGATVSRADFRVGEGEWATGEVVGTEVQVTFELHLRAAPEGAR